MEKANVIKLSQIGALSDIDIAQEVAEAGANRENVDYAVVQIVGIWRAGKATYEPQAAPQQPEPERYAVGDEVEVLIRGEYQEMDGYYSAKVNKVSVERSSIHVKDVPAQNWSLVTGWFEYPSEVRRPSAPAPFVFGQRVRVGTDLTQETYPPETRAFVVEVEDETIRCCVDKYIKGGGMIRFAKDQVFPL